MRVCVVLLLVSGCDYVLGLERNIDATLAEPLPPSIHDQPFGTPQPVDLGRAPVDDPSLTSNGLQLYYNFQDDIYEATRPTVFDPFTSTVVLNTTSVETTPEISIDGQKIWFSSDRATADQFDIWTANRPSPSDPWATAIPVNEVNSGLPESAASTDGRELVMVLARDKDLFETTRVIATDP